jgi:hypothetical protein
MAEHLGVSQAEESKMERRSELYIGTLKKFIEAMDGELVLAARFPDGVEVPIRLAEADESGSSRIPRRQAIATRCRDESGPRPPSREAE